MVAINSGPLLHVADLPSALQNFLNHKKAQYHSAAAAAHHGPGLSEAMTPAEAADQAMPMQNLGAVIPLSELERRAIVNALEYTKGDRAVAAHLLGIGRTTLYRKLKEYKLAG